MLFWAQSAFSNLYYVFKVIFYISLIIKYFWKDNAHFSSGHKLSVAVACGEAELAVSIY